MTKKSYLDDNKEIIEGFVSAIQKGLDYVFTHSDKEVAEVITSYFPDTSMNDLTEVIKRYRDADSWYRTTYITEEGFDRVQDIMDNSGKLDKKADSWLSTPYISKESFENLENIMIKSNQLEDYVSYEDLIINYYE